MNLPLLFFAGSLLCWLLALRNAVVLPGGTGRTGWVLGAVLLTAGLAALAAARYIGSSLDSDGYLQEPFFLIGGGSLLNLAGSCLTLVMLLRAAFRRRKATVAPGEAQS